MSSVAIERRLERVAELTKLCRALANSESVGRVKEVLEKSDEAESTNRLKEEPE